jgi:hypothetical protein
MTRRKRILAGAVAVLLVALPAGWYFGSPWWTLWRMREAARAGDAAALASYVDLAAVRQQAKAEFRAFWKGMQVGLNQDSPGGRHMLDLARRRLADPDQDLLIGLAELRPWLAEVPIRLFRLGGSPRAYRPYIVHRGLDAFEVRDEGRSLETGPVLTFRRHGLGWKLEGAHWGEQ